MAVVEPMEASNGRQLYRRSAINQEESVARISISFVRTDGAIPLPGFPFAVRHRRE
jgi:hypothetical protein